jgi:formylglycine-generating enzyme required for sulfatase activity
MGYAKGELNERPDHKVFLAEYDVDRTEVPAREFAEFLNARGNEGERYFTPDEYATVVLLPGSDADGRQRYAARAGYENFPANNVSWVGADAFCRWKGKRLPTEAEWEKAARGTDKRRYPWGTEAPSGSRARFAQRWEERGLGVLVPVDALPEGDSPYGALNMSGNVEEWVSDWYRQNLCDFCNPEGEANLPLLIELTGREGSAPDVTAKGGGRQAPPRENPAGPSTGSFKVLRGGSWREGSPDELTTTRRFWLDPGQRFPHTGFRCAK